MTAHIKTVAILTARPGKAEALKTLLYGMRPRCRAEPGNLRWDIWQDQTRADRYVLDELYQDGVAVLAHHEAPHFKSYLAGINDLADRMVLALEPAAVEALEPCRG